MSSEPNSTSLPQSATSKTERRRAGWIRRFFLLEERIGNVKSAGLTPEASGWLEFEAARDARDALLRLPELRPSNIAILTLRRTETLGLIHATMRLRGITGSSDYLTAQDWKHAESIDEIRELRSRLSESQRVLLEAALAEGGHSYLNQLDAKGRRRAARVLGRTAQQLIGLFAGAQQKIERLRMKRWLRIAPVLLLLVAPLGLVVRWFENRQQKDNLAFHQLVTVSSIFDIAYENTDYLVDGKVDNLGFHTAADDQHPWVMIDLGSSRRFSKVVIYNRAECCKERAVPLDLEVSQDGVKFERIAERDVKFDVWTLQGLKVTARYLRLRREGSGLFHLAEVEVFE